MDDDQEYEKNDSPIEQVRLTVPTTDDPTLPTLTFRTWILGPITCVILAFVTEFFSYRQSPFTISAICFQVLLYLLGKLMATTLPSKPVNFFGTNWSFSMNPGPFNIKEHVLITIFANSGLDSPYGTVLIDQTKIFYKKIISKWAALSLILTTQMLGYGFAGMFMKFLVDSPYMWWPLSLVDITFFRTLHEVETRPKGHITKFQFIVIVMILSFSYYIVPDYFFPSISALSFICWIWKHSVPAQLIGSGIYGLGIGSFGFDWTTISTFMANPFAIPKIVVINSMAGFIVFLYVITPIVYWSNSYHSRRFPFSSTDLYDFDGQPYNFSRVLNENDLTFNHDGYNNYSKIYMSIVRLFSLGFEFASLSATVTHFAIFHARDAWIQFRAAYKDNDKFHDVHNRLMKSYKSIPQWWFLVILVLMLGLAIFTCVVFEEQLQLPFWGVLLASSLTVVLILPFSVIKATTGQVFTLSVISEMVIGYLYPGKPLANIAFKAYGISVMDRATAFLYDFKLAHYMKIPPRSMFVAQVAGTLLSTVLHFGSSWWLLSTIDNICDQKKLPKGSQWTCPAVRITYNSNIIWGVIGPARVFAPHGLYSNMYYFFLVGFMATVLVWLLSKWFPEKEWIRQIHVPVIFGSGAGMPPSGAVNYWSWFAVAFVFNFIIYRKYKGWWTKYNYVLACGLDLGVAFSALLVSASLQSSKEVYGVNWWGSRVGDHCYLAQCPTASAVRVEGCPDV